MVPTSSRRPEFGDDARRIFRVVAKRHHVLGDAPHRPHQQIMQREVHQHRGDAGDQQRQQHDVDGKFQHRLAQRHLVEHDLEKLAAHRRRPHHAHDVIRLAGDQGVEGVDDRPPPRHRAHIDVLVDRRRQVGDGQQAALIAHLHRHRSGADAFEDLLGEALRHHAARRGIEHQRGGMRGGQPVVEPIEAEIGDRWNIDQDFRHHHEYDGEQQQLAGEAQAQGARRAFCGRPDRFVCRIGFRSQLRLNRRFVTTQ